MLTNFAARVAELNARDYSTNPFSTGFVRSDFAVQLRDYGENIRWWKCLQDVPFDAIGPNGETVNSNNQLFIEQSLTDDEKILPHDVMRQTGADAAFQYEQGQLGFSCLPDEIELSNGDRVLMIERRVVWRQTLKPNGSTRTKLARDWAADLTIIGDGAGTLEVEASGASFINWQSALDVMLVQFEFMPRYVFLDETDRNQPRGSDGVRMPQRGILTLENQIS